MADSSPHSLVPSFLEFSYDGKPIEIVDASLSLDFDNKCEYEKHNINNGERGYTLRRGVGIVQVGEIKVDIIKTPDGKRDDSLKQLDDCLNKIATQADPKDYNKSITFVANNSDKEKFVAVSFEGYVSRGIPTAPDESDFPQFTYSFVPYDSQTVTVG
jgi:hypothetical protein